MVYFWKESNMNSVKRLTVKEKEMKRHLKQFGKQGRSVRPARRGGFTLVELLTVLAIIALLIGLLVPALNTTRRFAKDVRQRAQFHSIEAALETFHGDYGDYPPSEQTDLSSSGLWTCGAQKLCEALVGLDLRGYDPVSNFDIPGTLSNHPEAYAITAPAEEESLKRRKGPYLKIDENVGIYNLEHLFGKGNTGQMYPGEDPVNRKFGPVICDTYKVKNVQIPDPTDESDPPRTITVKAGTPVLYYKANPASKKFPRPGESKPGELDTYIYKIKDNAGLVDLGVFTIGSTKAERDDTHHFDFSYTDPVTGDTGPEIFFNKISNPKVSAQRWPHNPDSYILISAGYDGIYGTDDDITNFSGE